MAGFRALVGRMIPPIKYDVFFLFFYGVSVCMLSVDPAVRLYHLRPDAFFPIFFTSFPLPPSRSCFIFLFFFSPPHKDISHTGLFNSLFFFFFGFCFFSSALRFSPFFFPVVQSKQSQSRVKQFTCVNLRSEKRAGLKTKEKIEREANGKIGASLSLSLRRALEHFNLLHYRCRVVRND